MDDEIGGIGSARLHADARKRIKHHTTLFRDRLTAQAKFLAELDGHDPVIAKDVDEAFEMLRGSRQRSRVPEFVSTLGSIALGGGASGFIAEVARTNGPRPEHTVGFVLLAFLGFAVMLIISTTKR